MDGAVLAHGGGVDELLIFVFPLVTGLGLWLITRRGREQDERDHDSPERT